MENYAEESKKIKRLRREIHKRLKAEKKLISKRLLKKIASIIQLTLNSHATNSIIKLNTTVEVSYKEGLPEHTFSIKKLKHPIKKTVHHYSKIICYDLNKQETTPSRGVDKSDLKHKSKYIILNNKKIER